jgi:hypothetical protein
METQRSSAGQFIMDQASSWSLFVIALGISAAGYVAIVLDLEVSRFIYGQASALLLGIEIASLITVFVLVLVLRSRLPFTSAPAGFCRSILDFFAIRRWHASVKLCLGGLLALPVVWFVHGNQWLFRMLSWMGRRALAMSDVQAALDGGAVAYQVILLGGVPLLFALHMVCRWKPRNRILPWLLVPFFFLGVFVTTLWIVAGMHSSS